MKKWIIAVGILIAVFVVGVYVFIPGELKITKTTQVSCTPNGAHRILADTSKWRLWWPKGNKAFSYADYLFTMQNVLPQGVDVALQHGNMSLSSRIVIVPVATDSIALVWVSTYPASDNPFKRISSYQQAVDLKAHFADVSSSLKTYLENPTNVYGYPIIQTSTKDTMLIAARASSTGKPGMEQVYALVKKLKEYAVINGAIQTGYPMLNITPLENNKFQFMVAIPVNKELAAKGDFFARRMVPGNFMMAEAKGGLKTVDDAMAQLQQYAIDHQRTSMAIPFQVMVTNRQAEQDTTKWITRIYYPVM